MYPTPSQIRVGPLQVPLRLDPTLETWGHFEWTPTTREIALAGLQSEDDWSTLLHELIHAGSEFYGIGLSERRTRALETFLWALFRDNPDLMLRWALVAAGRAPGGPPDAPRTD